MDVPSRLNEYPSGSTNATILSLHPNLSNSSVNFGNTASLLVVLKATSKGLLIRFNKTFMRWPKTIKPTEINKIHNMAMPNKK